MKQTILILLKKNKNIETIRKKYAWKYKNIKSHVTLVYPFTLKNQKKLDEHIKNSIKGMKPFNLSLRGLRRSPKDYYLYLFASKGQRNIKKLYKKLHSGILSDFKNGNILKYIPHLTLGVFETKKEIDKAIQKLKKRKIHFEAEIRSIQLVTLNQDYSIKKVKHYLF